VPTAAQQQSITNKSWFVSAQGNQLLHMRADLVDMQAHWHISNHSAEVTPVIHKQYQLAANRRPQPADTTAQQQPR
jgi:hypothetical protein